VQDRRPVVIIERIFGEPSSTVVADVARRDLGRN
jgi:hypothetical protein